MILIFNYAIDFLKIEMNSRTIALLTFNIPLYCFCIQEAEVDISGKLES